MKGQEQPVEKLCKQCLQVLPNHAFRGGLASCWGCYKAQRRLVRDYRAEGPAKRAGEKRRGDAHRNATCSRAAARRKRLADCYVRHAKFFGGLTAGQVPSALVDLKRQHLALTRAIRQAKKGT